MDSATRQSDGEKNDDDEQIKRDEIEAKMMENKDEGRTRSQKEGRMMMSNVSVALGEEASFKCVGFEVIVSIKR